MRKQWWLVEEHEAQMSVSSEHEFKGRVFRGLSREIFG